MLEEVTVESKYIYKGRIVNLRDDTVKLPNGRKTKREIVEHKDVVAIVALDEKENILMVKQYRKPVEQALLEIPAGGVEIGENADTSALREMQEETGHLPKQLKKIGGVYASPGYCTEFLHLYLATDLVPSKLSADDDEHIELVKVPLSKIPQLISSGEICDAKSVAALLIVITDRMQNQV